MREVREVETSRIQMSKQQSNGHTPPMAALDDARAAQMLGHAPAALTYAPPGTEAVHTYPRPDPYAAPYPAIQPVMWWGTVIEVNDASKLEEMTRNDWALLKVLTKARTITDGNKQRVEETMVYILGRARTS